MPERCKLEHKSKMEILMRAKLEEKCRCSTKAKVPELTEALSLALVIKGLLVPMVLIYLVL